MKQRLENYFRAGYPAIAIRTTEEQRACADILAAAKECGKGVATWSATEGLRVVAPSVRAIDDTADLLPALNQRLKNTVYILRDAATWPFDRDPMLARAMRDLMAWCPTEGSCVTLTAPDFRPHATIEKLVVVTDYTLPDAAALGRIIEGIAASANLPPGGDREALVRALSGLSTTEAENALALSLVEKRGFDTDVIYREKTAGVRRSGLLEIAEADPRGLSAIGGLDALKDWIKKRKRAYTPEAESYGLPAPKGILIAGIPGTGKSLAAKAIGTALGIPTLRLDIGSLFNSLVGESEARARQALQLAEALSPCVLWADEIEKGLAGASGSGSGDSGVTKRVFGTVISWMQERRRPVFLVATANDVTGLPPEFLRKGRFDEIFAVDLPSDMERAAIFAIHLRKRSRSYDDIMLTGRAISATENFTGSEIEAVVEAAMFEAFADGGREITETDLVAAAQATMPLAVTAKEKIDGIRAWAKNRARFASTPDAPATITRARKIG